MLKDLNYEKFTLSSLIPRLTSSAGIQTVIKAIFPFFLIVEFFTLFYKKRDNLKMMWVAYKIPILTRFVNAGLIYFINFDVFLFCFDRFEKYKIFAISNEWYWFLYAYIVWELSHFIFHFSCHKVRLLWCLHAPHHAPENMNLSVIYCAFFLHAIYATIIRISICAFLGVPISVLVFIRIIDGCWGSLIHVSEEVMPSVPCG